MIRIIVDNDADLAALCEAIEQGPGLPEVFYASGYVIQREGDGQLRSVGGGGKSTAVHHAGPATAEGGRAGIYQGGSGGAGASAFGDHIFVGRGGTGEDPSIPPCPACGASGGGGHGGACPNAGR